MSYPFWGIRNDKDRRAMVQPVLNLKDYKAFWPTVKLIKRIIYDARKMYDLELIFRSLRGDFRCPSQATPATPPKTENRHLKTGKERINMAISRQIHIQEGNEMIWWYECFSEPISTIFHLPSSPPRHCSLCVTHHRHRHIGRNTPWPQLECWPDPHKKNGFKIQIDTVLRWAMELVDLLSK